MKSKRADDKQEGGSHYIDMDITPWQAMEVWMTKQEFLGFLKGNAIKRLARSNVKDGIIDIKKARHEMDKYIEVYEKK